MNHSSVREIGLMHKSYTLEKQCLNIKE